jgi:hypothetical protein
MGQPRHLWRTPRRRGEQRRHPTARMPRKDPHVETGRPHPARRHLSSPSWSRQAEATQRCPHQEDTRPGLRRHVKRCRERTTGGGRLQGGNRTSRPEKARKETRWSSCPPTASLAAHEPEPRPRLDAGKEVNRCIRLQILRRHNICAAGK